MASCAISIFWSERRKWYMYISSQCYGRVNWLCVVSCNSGICWGERNIYLRYATWKNLFLKVLDITAIIFPFSVKHLCHWRNIIWKNRKRHWKRLKDIAKTVICISNQQSNYLILQKMSYPWILKSIGRSYLHRPNQHLAFNFSKKWTSYLPATYFIALIIGI